MSAPMSPFTIPAKPVPASNAQSDVERWMRTSNDVRYAQITHKEKAAIIAMEAVPEALKNNNQLNLEHPVTPTILFNPNQLPLLDRMAFIFTRVMARARREAQTSISAQDRTAVSDVGEDMRLQPEDVMSEEEEERFLANIDYVHADVKGRTVWFRRYLRAVGPGEPGYEAVAAARTAAGSVLPKYVVPTRRHRLQQENEKERAIIAEVELDCHGIAMGGHWNDKF